MGLRGDGSQLTTDAVKAGEAAGAAAGLKLSQTLGQNVQRNLPGAFRSFGTGILQGMGQEAFRGIENAISGAVSAIPDLMAKGADYLTTLEDIRDATGSSAESVSAFAGTLSLLGVPIDGMGTKLRTISVAIEGNAAAFTKLGIRTRDSNGVQRDTVAIINDVRAKMAEYASGAEKSALAAKLFGKSGLELLDFLSLSDTQYAQVTERVRELGLVMGGDALDEIEKATRAQKELDLAFLGLGVTLQAEIGPIVRNVVSQIAQFIVDNSAKIRDAIATVAAAIAGLVEGLTGVPLGGTWIDSLGDLSPEITETSKLNTTLADLNAKRDALIASKPKATSATNTETAAIDRQTKALDRQIAAIEAQDAASEVRFQRQIAGYAAVYQRQLDALDLAEREAEIAKSRQDDAIALAAAEEALRKERAKAQTGEYDPAKVADAEMAVAQARKQQADNEAQRERDRRRAAIEETKAYIESIAALEAGATNRKALATTLQKREDVLRGRLAVAQAKGDGDEVARLQAKIEAIQTAETRNQAAIRNGERKSEIEKAKTELADLRAAIAGSTSANTTAAAQWQKDWKENEAAIGRVNTAIAGLYLSTGGLRGALGKNGGAPPLGSGGGLTKALAQTAEDWKVIGEAIKGIFDDGKGGGILGAINAVVTALNNLTNVKVPDIVGWILDTFNPAWRMAPEDLKRQLIEGWKSGASQSLFPPGKPGGGFASGGTIPRGSWGWVGEAGIERAYSLPGGGTYIEPVAAAGGGGSSGSPAAWPDLVVVMDGDRVGRLVDRRNARLPRH